MDSDIEFKKLLSNRTTINSKEGNQEENGIAFISYFTISYFGVKSVSCSGLSINMIFYVVGLQPTQLLSGMIHHEDVEKITGPLEMSDNDDVSTAALTSNIVSETYLKPNEDVIRELHTMYPTCTAPFLYIPLRLIPVVPGDLLVSRHANGILIGRNGTVYRIEPQYDSKINVKINEKINQGVLKLANEIGLLDPHFIEIEDICPQAITLDNNCIFWTLFITAEILRNIYKIKDPNEVIKQYSSKSKEELQVLIKNFKTELITKIIPSSLKDLKLTWPDFEQFREKYPEYIGGKNGIITRRHKRTKTNRTNGRKSKQNRRRRTRRTGNPKAFSD